MADTALGVRPAVVVSREELIRSNDVVAVLVTSGRFETRSTLPQCVPFWAGQDGLVKDCVAQSESITFLPTTDLNLGRKIIGLLNATALREVIRAVGDMMGSDCEPD